MGHVVAERLIPHLVLLLLTLSPILTAAWFLFCLGAWS